MPKANITTAVNVADATEAQQVTEALARIVSLMTTQELIKVGKACVEKPGMVRSGLKFIS